MDGSVKDLAKYRMEKAHDDLERAKRELDAEDYKLALNRSYYAIFHGLRAVNALDNFDSSKHSGVIAHFNQYHIKNGDFPGDFSKKITSAMVDRQKSDYDDFYIASKSDAERQVAVAEEILKQIADFVKKNTD